MLRFSPRSRTAPLVAMLWVSAAAASAAHLYPETAAAWTDYVSATESRIKRELGSPHRFLAIDFDPDAAEERRAVLGGAIVVQQVETIDSLGGHMAVPSALVHHWRGDALIPGMTAAQLVARLQTDEPPRQEDVLQARVLERAPNRMRVYLKLQRSQFVTVVYNTEHVVTFARDSPTRATSTSTATRIAEVSLPNTPQERELPVGDDRGFLWRLNAYWRYEDVAGGVIAECESMSLSRDVPSLVRYLVSPLIESTARESMIRTLLALKAHFAPGS